MSKISLDLDGLVISHIITEDQKQAIIAWHQKDKKNDGSSRLIQILASFGAIVTGLGVILLIAANWDTISDMMKTSIMISATGLTYMVAYYWSYQNTHYPKTGQSLFLLGSMLYGASIFLLGQIYNLGGTFADALLIWAIPTVILAYVTGFLSIFFLSIVLIYAYIFGEISNSFDFSGFFIANIFIAIGYFSLSILRYHKNMYKYFSYILSWTGGASILGGLFAYTFIDFWRYGGSSWYSDRDMLPTFWITISIVVIGILATVIDIIRKKKIEIIGDAPLLVGIIPLVLIFWFTFLSIHSGNIETYTDMSADMTMLVPTIAMNIFFIGIIAAMLYIGVRRENRSIINIAMIYIAIYLFGKYLAFAFDSKMDGAYIFIGGGVACIAMTFLIEKIRRRLMLSMD